MRRRVAVISFSTLRTDPRVRKQLDLLTDHDVVSIGHGEGPEGVSEHVEVPIELQIWRYPRHLVVSRQYWQAYARNAAIAFVRDHVEPGGFDAVIANDVDAAGIGLWLRPRRGIHLDLHEFAPEQNSELWRFRRFVAPFLRWQLRTFATQAVSVTTVCQAIADRYRSEFGLEPGVVMNASPYREADPAPTGSPVRIVHAGAALRNRGIDVMMRGVGDAITRGADVTLDVHLMPNDSAYLAELTGLAGQTPGVRVLPPLAHAEMATAMARSDIGLHVLAPTNYNNSVALPNKIFDFVQARLGVIVGPSPEMARLVREYGLGAVTADFTAEALRDVVLKLSREQTDRWKAGAASAAQPLSAQAQVGGWREAFAALLD